MTAETARVSAASLLDDARGIARLAVDGVLGVTDIAERLHAAIGRVSPPLGKARTDTARGLAGFVYARVRDVARVVGGGIDAALRPFAGALPVDSLQREHAVAALNGVIGDRLARAGNPLAIEMRLQADETAAPTGRIAVFVHGLCMHDRHWPRGPGRFDATVRALGFTPTYLRYNTGRAIAANGADFSCALETLIAGWPVRVTQLALIGHSMGGLVARQACEHARRDDATWLRRLKTMVFLGTPHRGSALERAGTRVDVALGMSPYSAPFVALGGLRSAGIRDLGRGIDFALPDRVRCYAIAGRLKQRSDGLVGVASALGLPVPAARTLVIEGAGHLALMHHASVREALERWLRPAARAPRTASAGQGDGRPLQR